MADAEVPQHPGADHHNTVLDAARARVDELEPKLAAVLEPILRRAGNTAARKFRALATHHESLHAAGPLTGVQPTSTMIAVRPRPDEAAAIADPDGAPASDLHCTLAFLGEIEGPLEPIREAIAAVAASHGPLVGVVAGYGEFQPPGCGILLPDVPGLVELRCAVTAALVTAGIDYSRDHGFQPHITVDGDPEPGEAQEMLERAAGAPLHFDSLLIVRGDTEVLELPLVGPRPLTAAGSDQEKAAEAVQRAETELSDARESGNAARIQRAETRLSDALEDLERVQEEADWTAPAADELVDTDALAAALRGKTDPIRLALIHEVLGAAFAGAGLSFDVSNPLIDGLLAQTGKHITGIADTTQANVMRAVGSAYDQGLSIPDTAKLITQVMHEAAGPRAIMIARTEMTSAVNGASLAAAQLIGDQTGKKMTKTWLTAPGAQYPRHEEYDGLDGQTVGQDEPFEVGADLLQYPGDPDGSPEEVINCFPAETPVEFPFLRAVMRRWYEGDLIRLRLSTGYELAVTPNHPVLGEEGVWVPAGELGVRDCLVGAAGLGVAFGTPHPKGPVAKIGEVYDLARVGREPERVALSPPDLHGDAPDGEIEVVPVDGSLLLDREAASNEEVMEFGFAMAGLARHRTSGGGMAEVVSLRRRYLDGKAAGLVSGAGECSSLPVAQAAHTQAVRLGDATRWDGCFPQASADDAAINAVRFGDSENGFPAHVSLPKVNEIKVEAFHGYVYNLDTGAGWYSAMGVLCRNCRCAMTYSDGTEVEAE